MRGFHGACRNIAPLHLRGRRIRRRETPGPQILRHKKGTSQRRTPPFGGGRKRHIGKLKHGPEAEGRPLPEAIFAASDVVAPGLLKVLREYEIRIPEEIGVITFNNTSLSQLAEPPLTSVEVFLRENADAAVICMELLWQKKIHPKQIIISCKLEERGSVRRK